MVTTPSSNQPKRRGRSPSDPSPKALLEDMRTVLQEQLEPIVAHVDEQVSDLRSKVASLERSIPNAQALVDRAVAQLEPALSRQINDKLEGVASNGNRAASAISETRQVVSETKPKLSDKITELTDVVGAVADVLLTKFYPLYTDHRKEARLDRQEARADKMMDTNPFMIAETMRVSNSPLLPMYTAAFAPIPQVVAEARVRETTDALLVGMRARAEASRVLREEQSRQRETPSPSSPSSSESPISTSPLLPTQPSAPKTDGVTMNSASKFSQRRLSLREVMG